MSLQTALQSGALGSALSGNGQPQSIGQLAENGFKQNYVTGNWFTRTFDSGKLDAQNSALAASQDRQYNYLMAQYTNAYNAKEAQKQRDFEERMSNTQYTRAVKQLRELGLNPYLAVQGLSGSVPQGSAASGSSAYSSSRVASTSAYGSQQLVRIAGELIGNAVSAFSASRGGFKIGF